MQSTVPETAEETGLEVESVGEIGIHLLQGGGWPDILAHVFTANAVSGTEHSVDAGEIG